MWRMALKAGRSDGWARLTHDFEGVGPMERSRGFMSVQIGWMQCKSCVRVGSSEAGLTLRMQVPFRFGNPDLFIPWQRLEYLGRGSLLGLSVKLKLKNEDLPIAVCPGIFGGITMLDRLAEAVQQSLKRSER